jgi:ADP-heptose:LPS heptosyltransferase
MRILVLKLSSLGDLFHALPTVHMLRQAYPDSTIDWVTQDTYVDMVRSCFVDVDRVIAFPRKHFFQKYKSFFTELRTTEYDLILDLQGLLKSALVARAARGKQRIGPSFHREGSFLLYKRVAGKKNLERHAVDQTMDVIDLLGIKRSDYSFPLSFPQKPKKDVPHIVIAPASRWPSKNWPEERFSEVARHLQEKWNAYVSIIGAPGEETLCKCVSDSLATNSANHAGKTSLQEMGSIIA